MIDILEKKLYALQKWCKNKERLVKKYFLKKKKKKFLHCQMGDIYFAKLGINIGGEIDKSRPVLVFQGNHRLLRGTDTVFVFPITSNTTEKRFKVSINHESEAPTLKTGGILVDQGLTISKIRLEKYFGKASLETLQEVQRKFLDLHFQNTCLTNKNIPLLTRKGGSQTASQKSKPAQCKTILTNKIKTVNKSMFSAVLFDMDGVLINSEHIWDTEELGFLQSLVQKPLTKKDQTDIIGGSVQRTCEMLQKKCGLHMTAEEFQEKYIQFGLHTIYEHVTLLPNVLILLQNLKKNNIPCALVSSSPYVWIHKALEKTEIATYFQEIVSADDIGGKGKPEPDIYLFAAEKINVSPQKCLVIEDSDHGLISGKKAGMTTWGIRNGVNDAQTFTYADQVKDGIPQSIESQIQDS